MPLDRFRNSTISSRQEVGIDDTATPRTAHTTQTATQEFLAAAASCRIVLEFAYLGRSLSFLGYYSIFPSWPSNLAPFARSLRIGFTLSSSVSLFSVPPANDHVFYL